MGPDQVKQTVMFVLGFRIDPLFHALGMLLWLSDH